MPDNPFPLNIATKENHPALLAWFLQFGTSKYVSAEDINKIVAALNYLKDSLATGEPVNGDTVMVYDVTTDSQQTLNTALLNIFSYLAYYNLQTVLQNGATADIPLQIYDADGNTCDHNAKGLWAMGAQSGFILDTATGQIAFSHNNGRRLVLMPGQIMIQSRYDGQGNLGELFFRSDNLLQNLTLQAPNKSGTKTIATTDDITDSVDDAVEQLIGGAPSDANTLKELNDKIIAINAIIGGATADGDALVNTVAELLDIFQTYPEGSDIAAVLTGKINSSDIVNNLTQVVAGKVLDARQGKVLKDLIDGITATVATNTANISANTAAIAANAASIAGNAAAILLRGEMMIKYDQHIVAPSWGTNALNAVIGSSITLSGSLTARNFGDTNLFTRTCRVGIVSTAVAGNATTGRQGTGYFSRNTGFDYLVRFGSSDNAALTGIRAFIGMTGQNNLSQNVEPDAQTNALGFARISTSTNWQLVHNDSSGTATLHDSGFPANTESDELYEGRIRVVPTGIEFTLTRLSNGAVFSYTATTDIPAANHAHGMFFMCTNNANAALCGVDWAGHKLKLGV